MVESFDQGRQSFVQSRGRWAMRLEHTIVEEIGGAFSGSLLDFRICADCQARLADFSLVGFDCNHRAHEKHSVIYAAGPLCVVAKQAVRNRKPATLFIEEAEVLAQPHAPRGIVISVRRWCDI